jgi:DNA-directed RNA polymerase subunit RPC12/RpoP
MPSDEAFRVRCGACSHEWKLADLPQPISELVRIKANASCPECGSKDLRMCLTEGATND